MLSEAFGHFYRVLRRMVAAYKDYGVLIFFELH